MVTFTCNTCNSSLKKAVIVKHLFKCSAKEGYTCIDCGIVFGENYVMHNSCITENEKYGSKDYVENEKKGMKKQEQWLEAINMYLESKPNLDRSVNLTLRKIINSPNIPQKEKPFMNFIKNFKINPKTCTEVWNILKDIKQEMCDRKNDVQNKNLINNTNRCNELSENSISDDKLKKPYKNNVVKDFDKGIENEQVREKNCEFTTLTSNINSNSKKRNIKTSFTTSNLETKSKKIKTDNTDQNKKTSEQVQLLQSDINDMNKEYNSSKIKDRVQSSGDFETSDLTKNPFHWKKRIKKILESSNSSKIKLKKLEKLLVAEYLKEKGLSNDFEDEGKAIFAKKLKNSKYVIESKYLIIPSDTIQC